MNIPHQECFYINDYRMIAVSNNKEVNLHSFFVPGGLGLGSEYLASFAKNLHLPGQSFLVDFPGDGSNRFSNYQISWEKWKNGLLNVVERFTPCVLIAHSFSGMIALSIPELEDKLAGIVLMNTTPKRAAPQLTAPQPTLPDVLETSAEYQKNPTDENLRKMLHACRADFFLPEELKQGEVLLSLCAINAQSNQWGWNYFYPTYEAQWTPKIPCMVITSEYDSMCPPEVFVNNPDYNHHDNIKIFMIKNAGHFPWLNHFEEIKNKFDLFYQDICK